MFSLRQDDFLFYYVRNVVKNRQCIRWWGVQSGSSQRRYICYLCRDIIDTESAKDHVTKHVMDNVVKHGDDHIKELAKASWNLPTRHKVGQDNLVHLIAMVDVVEGSGGGAILSTTCGNYIWTPTPDGKIITCLECLNHVTE